MEPITHNQAVELVNHSLETISAIASYLGSLVAVVILLLTFNLVFTVAGAVRRVA